MAETRTYEGVVTPLSRLPTRLRWRVSVLLDHTALANAVAAELAAHPAVRLASANPVTGTVLAELVHAAEPSEAEAWLRAAIGSRLTTLDAAPLAQKPTKSTAPTSLQRLLDMTDGHRDLRRRAVAFSLANGLEEAVPPILVGLAADTAALGAKSLLARLGFATLTSRLVALGGIGAGLWLLAAAVEYRKERAVSKLANEVRHDLAVRLYEHLQTLDISEVEARDVASWMALLDKDVGQIHSFFRQGADPFFQMATNLVLVGSTLVIVSPAMAAVQLLLLPGLVLASTRLLKPIREKHIVARRDQERLNARLTENLTGMATVVSFGAQPDEGGRVREASERYRMSSLDAERVGATYVPTLRAIAGAGFITTLLWGGSKAASGAISVGAVDTTAMTQLRLLSALARMGVGLDQYQKTSAAVDRISQALRVTPTVRSGARPLPWASLVADIEFDDVVFGYDPGRPVLKGLALRCAAGKTTGIVGASGAGKSTLLKLLLRFWDVQAGQVRLGGMDVRELDLEDLRRSAALVAQHITLFGGTIRDNIAYGRRGASHVEVVQAARVAEADEFIEALPGGYDSPIGFGGLTLSGGQRQRIAIARAVLANRPVLLFDEATSALDHATEAAVQRSVEAATADRTTVIIAHRLSTIRHADRIYVIDDGRVREQGRHDELLAADGAYASMWRVQTGERGPRPRARAAIAKPRG